MREVFSNRFVVSFTLFLVLLFVQPVSAGLDEDLLPRLKSHRGRVAVAVKHLKTGDEFSYQADEPMPTASLIKLPVMIEAYGGMGGYQGILIDWNGVLHGATEPRKDGTAAGN